MKNRTVKIAAVAFGVLIIGGLLPQIMLYNNVRKLTCIDIKAEYFTDFSVTYNGDVQTIDNGGVSLKIPAYYKQCEDDPKHYSGDDNEEVFYYYGPEKYEADLLDTEVFKDIKGLYSVGKIKRGFEKLGHGIPDSTYNTHKCILLTDSNDYSFWDMEKGRSFVVTAAAKELVYEDYIEFVENHKFYIYERDSICGIIDLHKGEDGYYASFTVFNADDLNMGSNFHISAKSSADIFAIVNSVEFTDNGSTETI